MAEKNHTQVNRKAAKDLASKGSSLMSLIDSAYIVIGLDGDIHEANEAAQHLLGLTHSALVGHDFFSRWVVPNMGSALVDQVISDRLVKGYVTDMKRANGETFIASINAQLVINQEDYSKVIECLITDNTKAQQGKDEFAETLRSVTGGIAHLINNQMASVVGTADLVKMELADRPELAAKLDRISESGMQASDVAHNLVDYADTSDYLTMDEVRCEDVINEVKTYYTEKLASEKPRNLVIRIPHKTRRVFANHESIVKMLKHLLHNAVDATQEGGNILISSKNVVLLNNKTGLNKKYVLIAIEDHGHGMDAATQQKIFEPFFSTRFAGRGMSLPQVLKTIKQHNGQIRVKTGVGKGSIFKVYLPASG